MCQAQATAIAPYTHLLSGQDVCALDVPVHHPLVVQVLQTLQHLGNVDCHQGLREHPKAVGLDDRTQSSVLHELKNDVQVRAGLEGAHIPTYRNEGRVVITLHAEGPRNG